MTTARANVTTDDDRVRVTSWTFDDVDAATGMHLHEFDYVVIPVTGGSFAVSNSDGSARHLVQVAGVPYVGIKGTHHDVTLTSPGTATFVEVELKRP